VKNFTAMDALVLHWAKHKATQCTEWIAELENNGVKDLDSLIIVADSTEQWKLLLEK
jgi:hypothetical protein